MDEEVLSFPALHKTGPVFSSFEEYPVFKVYPLLQTGSEVWF
jgi:hypothetical protein